MVQKLFTLKSSFTWNRKLFMCDLIGEVHDQKVFILGRLLLTILKIIITGMLLKMMLKMKCTFHLFLLNGPIRKCRASFSSTKYAFKFLDNDTKIQNTRLTKRFKIPPKKLYSFDIKKNGMIPSIRVQKGS